MDEQRRKLWLKHERLCTQVREIEAAAEHRDPTDEEVDRIAELEAQKEQIVAGIKNEDDAARRAPSIEIIKDAVLKGPGPGIQHSGKPGGPGKKFAELFGRPAPSAHFETAGEFLEVVHSGLAHPGLQAAHSGTMPSEGGFSIPGEFAAQWLDTALESEVIRPRATTWPMTSSSRKIPAWDGADLSGGSPFGGLTLQWADELDSLTERTATMRLMTLTAHKAAILSAVSNELLSDGLNFEMQLETAMQRSLAWGLDEAFVNGTGAGMPLGILNASSTVSQAKESGQTANTVVWENIRRMWSRLHPACIPNAVWICNPNVIPELFNLQSKIQNAAASDYVGGSAIYLPGAGNVAGPVAGTLLGKPLLTTDKMQTLGTVGDIVLVDLTQYAVGLRADMSIAKSQHAGFTSDKSYFRVIARVDGAPIWNESYTPFKGSDALSWCVTLATRA